MRHVSGFDARGNELSDLVCAWLVEKSIEQSSDSSI